MKNLHTVSFWGPGLWLLCRTPPNLAQGEHIVGMWWVTEGGGCWEVWSGPSFGTSRFWEPQASAGGENSWFFLFLPVAWMLWLPLRQVLLPGPWPWQGYPFMARRESPLLWTVDLPWLVGIHSLWQLLRRLRPGVVLPFQGLSFWICL